MKLSGFTSKPFFSCSQAVYMTWLFHLFVKLAKRLRPFELEISQLNVLIICYTEEGCFNTLTLMCRYCFLLQNPVMFPPTGTEWRCLMQLLTLVSCAACGGECRALCSECVSYTRAHSYVGHNLSIQMRSHAAFYAWYSSPHLPVTPAQLVTLHNV